MARLGLLLAALLLPAVVFAAEGGMPQLDYTTFASQGFWLVICFVALFVIMTKVALPRVSEVLNLRDNKIRHDLETAEQLKAEAEALQEKIEANLSAARTEAGDILRRASENAAEYTATATAKTDAEINNTLSEALDNIASARNKALADIDATVADVATGIVKKLADIDIKADDVQKTVQQVQ